MAPRKHRLVMPETGDTVTTQRGTRYVLLAQWPGKKAKVVQGSSYLTTIRAALDRRLRRPYTYTMTHDRPDYAIYDLTEGRVIAQSKGDHHHA